MGQAPAGPRLYGPAASTCPAFSSGRQPLGDPVQEQISDLVFAQVAPGECREILLTRSPNSDTAVRNNSKRPALVFERIFDVSDRKPPPASQSLGRPARTPQGAHGSRSGIRKTTP